MSANKGTVLDGPVTIRGDLIVSGNLNKGVVQNQVNQGQGLQVVQGVLQAVCSQGSANPNAPANGDYRMYGQNSVINGAVVPGGTDGYFQIDQYINGAWQHLFEIQPSTTGNANVLDLFISGRLFARDSLLSAPGRFFFKAQSTPFTTNNVFAIAYGNGVFLAGGYTDTVAASHDLGVTWGSLITNPFSGGGAGVKAIAFGNNIFVCGDKNGHLATITCSTAGVLGSFSALITNPFGTDTIFSIVYGNGVFIAAGADNHLSRSTDYGVTWSSFITNPFGGVNQIYALAYGNGVFIAVGANGQIMKSLDYGVTWGSLISNPFGTTAILALAYGHGVFVAVSNGGTIARSLDNGVTWGSLIANPFGAVVLYGIAYGNGIFVAAAGIGTVARSLDLGLTWGVQYNINSTLTVLTTYIDAIASNGQARFVVGGLDTSNISLAYTDYVEAGAGIVSSGSNSNGSYIQFADGTMEEWAVKASITTSVADGAVYVNSVTVTFPIAFVGSLPIIITGSLQNANMTWGGMTQGLTLATTNIYVVGPANSCSGYPFYIAVGKWK